MKMEMTYTYFPLLKKMWKYLKLIIGKQKNDNIKQSTVYINIAYIIGNTTNN